ncbi:MAG: hypothetical protein U0M21_10620 [Emergencia sp.]|nr:hypothetical protein [Emergencia sp.]
MSSLIISLLIALIPCVVTPIMGYIVWLLKKMAKKDDANDAGTMLLLRIQLIDYHDKYAIRKRPMPPYAYENFCDMYKAYQALGGNSMVEKMAVEMKDVHLQSKEVEMPKYGEK